MSSFDIKPDKSKCIELLHALDLFTIIDLKSNTKIGVTEKGINQFNDLQKKYSKSTIEDFVNSAILYNLSYSLTDDNIFVLYDGSHTLMEANSYENCSFTPTIRIFDWNGEFINSFVLREPIIWIEYNKTTKKLYAISIDQKLFEYDIEKYV